MKKVIIRADGNLNMGYGHVIRSLALAEILRSTYECIFAIQAPDEFLRQEIQKVCSAMVELPEESDFKKEAERFALDICQPEDMVVLDGYQFGQEYQQQVKQRVFKLISIDDIFATHFYSDVVINHTSGINPKKYSTEPYTRLYLGTDYLILRPPFLRAANKFETGKTLRAFINLGGTDHKNYTVKSLRKCLAIPTLKSIDVVIGSLYPFSKELDRLIQNHPDRIINVHSNLSAQDMADLMQKSAIGICSASTVAYEYCLTGGLLLIYKIVPNQKNLYSFLIKNKIAFPAAQADDIGKKLHSPNFISDYQQHRKKVISGNSEVNLKKIFYDLELERNLEIRKATEEDVLVYFNWVNEASVRRNSIRQEPILLEDHTRWFQKKVSDPSSNLYIFHKEGKPVGQVRLDKHRAFGEIDYSIDMDFRNLGMGKIILNKAIEAFKTENPGVGIKGVVKESNIASNRVFLSLGFSLKGKKMIDGVTYHVYIKK